MPTSESRLWVQVVLRNSTIDLAGLDGREALGGGEADDVHGVRVAEDGGSGGAAEVGVEAPASRRAG